MVYSEYTKLRILHFHAQGCRPPAITKWLEREGIAVSRRGVAKFITRFLRRGTIARQPGSGRKTKITDDIQRIVEHQMRQDDETTASQLHVLLSSLGYHLDLHTILRCRTALGWTYRGSAYCQLIRDVNKQKRLEFARAHRNDRFDDVIFTDECSVQLESHCKRCCRKQGEPAKNKPRLVTLINNLEPICRLAGLFFEVAGAYKLEAPPQGIGCGL